MRRNSSLGPAGTLCLLLAALLIAPAAGAAQAQDEIHGTVTDATGGVIVGAVVELTVSGREPVSGRTDDRGRYRFARVEPGDYSLRVSMDGFMPFVRPVRASSGPITEMDVVLQVLITEKVD